MSIEEIDRAISELKARREQLIQLELEQPTSEPIPKMQHIVVVGGAGQLGKLFVSLFDQSGYEVTIIEKDDWQNKASVFAIANLVLIAVPINQTTMVIEQLPELSEHCVLADVTSIKREPLAAMLNKHSGPVLGLHPMFGPDVDNLKGQTIIVTPGRAEHESQWFVSQLQSWGGVTLTISAEEHDRSMALIQVMRHFSTVAYGRHLMGEEADLSKITDLSSPIYRLELAMVGRLFAQDPNLYTDIIFSNQDNIDMMKRYIGRFQNLLEIVAAGDKQAFIAEFNEVTDWFGEYAQQFMVESTEMLTYKNSSK